MILGTDLRIPGPLYMFLIYHGNFVDCLECFLDEVAPAKIACMYLWFDSGKVGGAFSVSVVVR